MRRLPSRMRRAGGTEVERSFDVILPGTADDSSRGSVSGGGDRTAMHRYSLV
ncbi:hypothetical protein BN12_270017 [Nostocoides japonicum T1-X7]|uniref:Uncharacterized protein n=1 Tax=Nostocoides japonicum T1-X7 TaxID=1194083 RepID=A0A077LX86_9MICO|nr:hypothetical protein BN12_270017 [Tetrasphaera japonica T1-X7]